ncbi:isocitrate lyase/phosphoenolpyruvate mutase family protein [Amycolatopsis sp. Poz14]|uniref:isocitrate lyase/PEP mutase family protein n=1 Tax=Amycolatopsis sp. Poz14 TaxID=1447705 RepID=UPI001EE8B0B8|nr:isocitrate lyase/phosphoenolpyruvate mutase family protein [Amycolatopsis sp. Poz14]MCG3751548.1 isocitrate lyase/phosphoenolpyruvate mutase family protein [Amycolatopsis sp. Poz14]
MNSLQDKANLFRELHAADVLVLPNAWDAGSAVAIERAGAPAIATTSGGVSWALARGDGQHLSRAEMLTVIAQIAAAVKVPVTADIEGGYGLAPSAVAETVRGVVEAGAVGVNLEDSRAGTATLFTPDEQAERFTAARAAAATAGLSELWINARTDVYLFGIGEPTGRFDDVLTRARVYADAGADSIFVPGLTDVEVLAELAKSSPIPVSAMAGPGAPPVSDLAAAGVRRVSVGTSIAQAAYSLAHHAAAEVLKQGTYGEVTGALDFGTVNGWFN